mmetsp:Transcript_42870/g.93521  ORF Transcript_42870/g.93521 Transcript_42870/m.93521 type:complete len:91 (+) Transcript_42870:41-313(+)
MLWRSKRFSWQNFYVRKGKVYDVFYSIAATMCIGTTIYLGTNIILVWNDSVHRTWLHYVRKERERADLIQLIREAREAGNLGPSTIEEFK